MTFPCIPQGPGQFPVLPAGCRVSGRMVVHCQDGCCMVQQCRSERFPGVDHPKRSVTLQKWARCRSPSPCCSAGSPKKMLVGLIAQPGHHQHGPIFGTVNGLPGCPSAPARRRPSSRAAMVSGLILSLYPLEWRRIDYLPRREKVQLDQLRCGRLLDKGVQIPFGCEAAPRYKAPMCSGVPCCSFHNG